MPGPTARALGALIEAPSRRAALARAAIRRVEAFRIDAIAPRWLELIGVAPEAGQGTLGSGPASLPSARRDP